MKKKKIIDVADAKWDSKTPCLTIIDLGKDGIVILGKKKK